MGDASEREKGGPSTQLIMTGQLSSFPLALERFVSVYRETDLYQKEWIADCKKCDGKVGGPERLYSSLSYIVNTSPILPMSLEVVTVRDLAVCRQAPLSGRKPGVLVMDMSPPSGASEFGGWTLPDHCKKKRCIRLSNFDVILYFVPNEANPAEACDIFAFARMGAPIPQWLVPLSLLKRFLAAHFISVFKAIKVHITEQWDALKYGERIGSCPHLYGSIAELRSTAHMQA